MSSFIYPGTTVTAGNGLAWFINDEGGFSSDPAGILGNTTSVQDVLQDNLLHYGYLIAEDDGHTFWTPTTVDPSYVVHQRQIYISDTDGWARIVDSYTNLGVYLTRSLDYSISFEGLGDVEYISSDALPSIENTDFWVIASDSSGLNTGAAGLLLGDSAELTTMLANAHTVYGDVTTQIPFGETLSFMTFVLKGQSVAEVQADMNDLLALAPGTLDGLSAEQIDSIVNWDLPTAALTREGTAGADVLAGTDAADSLNGAAGNDVLLGDDGDDLLSGGTGRDTLHGGNGNDVLWGNDAPYVAKAWAAGSSFNADISFALLGETVNSGTTGSYSALIYPDQDIAATLYDAPLDVTFVLDVTANSGAYFDMEGTPYGNSGLAAQIAAIEAYLEAIERGPNIRETHVTIIKNGFGSTIQESFWTFSDSNNDGRSDLMAYLEHQISQGGLPTYDLESALIAANDRYASGAFADRELVIFATSDLGNLGYLVPELNTLAYHNVRVHTVGVDVGMGLTNRQLDILDDGVRNYSSVGMTSNAQQLMINTITSPFDQGGVSHAEVWVNGVLHSTITAADMTRLPTGLVVDFDVTTLKLGETDYVQLKVFPTGGDQTPLTATLTVAEPPVMDGGDVLVGGAGEDSLYGQDGNDLLIGGQGRDLLDGGNGIDTASWDDSLSRVVVNLSNGQTKGGAKGDTLVSIENLIGSRFDDILTGDAGKNSLHGGAGNDRLVGGGGNDIFIFASGDGHDTIADFARRSKSEKIDLTDFDIASFAELKSMGSTVLGNAVFDFGGDDMLIIRGFSLADLNAGDFIL